MAEFKYAPLDMYNEVNTKCNLPAQIDIEATQGVLDGDLDRFMKSFLMQN